MAEVKKDTLKEAAEQAKMHAKGKPDDGPKRHVRIVLDSTKGSMDIEIIEASCLDLANALCNIVRAAFNAIMAQGLSAEAANSLILAACEVGVAEKKQTPNADV